MKKIFNRNFRFLNAPLIILAFSFTGFANASPKSIAKSDSEWNFWYTVTILPNTPYAYYNESLERSKGRIHFKTNMWKKEEGFINSEQLGVFSQDDSNLTPLFYNFHATYRSSEISIDGNSENGHMKVRIKRGQQELPVMTRALPSKAFFASIFPFWLRRTLRNTPAEQVKSATQPFVAILEDNQDSGFSAENGRFQVLSEDDFAKSSGSIRVQVEFNGQKSFWYLDKTGAPIRIEIPNQRTRVERVTEKQAKSFLQTK